MENREAKEFVLRHRAILSLYHQNSLFASYILLVSNHQHHFSQYCWRIPFVRHPSKLFLCSWSSSSNSWHLLARYSVFKVALGNRYHYYPGIYKRVIQELEKFSNLFREHHCLSISQIWSLVSENAAKTHNCQSPPFSHHCYRKIERHLLLHL